MLFIEDFHIERNLRRRLKQKEFSVTFDRDFDAVIRACAEPRPGRLPLTWIRDDIIEAYTRAHHAGIAHSVEVWDEEGNLVGGAYGLAIGRVFFTKSQFSRKRDASKVGFATLNCHLQRWGFVLNDGKHLTGHLAQLGFTLIPRHSFNALLATACKEPSREGALGGRSEHRHRQLEPEIGGDRRVRLSGSRPFKPSRAVNSANFCLFIVTGPGHDRPELDPQNFRTRPCCRSPIWR